MYAWNTGWKFRFMIKCLHCVRFNREKSYPNIIFNFKLFIMFREFEQRKYIIVSSKNILLSDKSSPKVAHSVFTDWNVDAYELYLKEIIFENHLNGFCESCELRFFLYEYTYVVLNKNSWKVLQ